MSRLLSPPLVECSATTQNNALFMCMWFFFSPVSQWRKMTACTNAGGLCHVFQHFFFTHADGRKWSWSYSSSCGDNAEKRHQKQIMHRDKIAHLSLCSFPKKQASQDSEATHVRSAAEDGKCVPWFHPSSNTCFDCNLKEGASILMISLVLDPYLRTLRKSGLPSDLDLSA